MKNTTSHHNDQSLFLIVQFSAFSVFIGRAWQHLFWDAPYRELLWDQKYFEWIVNKLVGMSWDEFVTHPQGDHWLQNLVITIGLFYLICALVTLLIKKLPIWSNYLLVVGSIGLIILALIYMKDKFFHIGQFFEYFLQFSSPLFLVYLLKRNANNTLVIWMKVAIALTFTCHGLYAIGYYPRPLLFMSMTQNILGLNSLETHYFLYVAGVLDFVVSLMIFLPRRWAKPALIYAVCWGFLTALARIVGNFYWEFPLESLNQWTFESVYRIPHFMIPLFLYLKLRLDSKALS